MTGRRWSDLREWIQRLMGSLRRGRPDAEIQEELRLHLELAVEDARHRGVEPDEAARAARLRSGGVLQAVEALRDQRGLPWLDDLARDLRHALRTLRRSPAFTTVALLTLALGIGANTAIYQLLDAIRLRPLPVEDPQQLAIVELADLTRWRGRRTSAYPVLSNPLWERFRDHQRAFSGVLAWSNVDLPLDHDAGIRVARGLFVSGEFFEVLGVRPLVGRVFTAADDHPGCGAPVAVVSYGFWRSQLGGNPAAIGRTIALRAQSVEVIGVTPAGFTGPEVGRSFDVAVPICSQETLGREEGWLASSTTWWLTVMGRRPPGVLLERVNSQLDALSPGLFRATLPPGFPSNDADGYLSLRLRAAPGSAGVSALRRYGDPLVVLLATTGLVLLLACTNLANLILARASTREREFALRLAVGASRGRLVRQMMVEHSLLAAGGAVAGLALASASSRFLTKFLGHEPSLALPLDGRLIAFVVSITALTCLTFGWIPAWRSSRLSAQDAMKATARSLSGSRERRGLSRVLVVAQVALSLVLLFAALLFTGTLRNLLAVDAGFHPDDVTVARVDFSRLARSQDERAALKRQLLERIRSVPGVSAAAEVRHVPLGGTGSSLDVWPDGADPAGKRTVRLNATSDGYLDAMGIRLTAGRDFDARDSVSGSHVAIVNRSLADRLGLVGNPIGQRFRAEWAPSEPRALFEIVGLVPDTKHFTLREEFLPMAFVPIAHVANPRPFTDFVIRSTAPPARLSAVVRSAVSEVNPAIDADLRAFDSSIRDGLGRERLMATLSGFFGVLSAFIAAIGLYGVLSYLVARRTNEIGVRMALGARRLDILMMVLREAGALVAMGLVVGSVLGLAAAGSARSLVFGLEPFNVGLVGLACALLAVVAGIASLLPARRAAWLDPLGALRDE